MNSKRAPTTCRTYAQGREHSQYIHGMSGTRPYRIWRNMKNRCHRVQDIGYPQYGAKGISVCDNWRQDFQVFWNDMGSTYFDGATIERIDNSSGYCPDNCKWATPHEQARNKRNNQMITIGLVTQCIKDWCDHYNVHPTTVWHRRQRGLPIDLWFVPPFHNSVNRRKERGTSSRYKGVSWEKAEGKWRSKIYVNKRRYYLCEVGSEEDAAIYHDVASQIFFGKLAYLNFPSHGPTISCVNGIVHQDPFPYNHDY